jgi:hypothetical protein
MMPEPTRVADKAWAFIRSEILAGRPFPTSKDIAVSLGRAHRGATANDILHCLVARGVLQRTYPRRAGNRIDWALTRLGRFEIEHPETDPDRVPDAEGDAERAAPLASPSKPKTRKPRRTGSPKRVPHKTTQVHKKPSRQQRRESERQREHQVTA